MKHDFLRRCGALMLSLVMALSLAVTPAMADDAAFTVTIGGVSPAALRSELQVGGSATIAAVVADLPAGASAAYAWSQSGTGTVKFSSTATAETTIEAATAGSVTITVTVTPSDGSAAKTADYPLTITAITTLATSVTVDPAALSMTEGVKDTLKATVLPADATDKTVTWSSDKPGVATVDPVSGEVTAVSAGTVSITATANDGSGAKGSCTVTVEAAIPPATSISFVPALDTLSVGQVKTVSLAVEPSGGAVMGAVWTSGDEKVVRVGNVNGGTARLTAVAPGETTVTVTAPGLEPAKLLVRVSGIVIELNGTPVGSSMNLTQRDTVTLTAKPYGDAVDLGQAIWESSSNGIAAITTSGGRLTGNTLGTATITARVGNKYMASCTVAVVEDTSALINAGSVSAGSELALNSSTIKNRLNAIAREKGYGSVDYITSLSVPTDQGILHYTYIYEGDTGAGVGSEKYYLNARTGQLSLNDLSFVPRADFSGSADIRYSAWCGSQSFSGIIRVTVNALTGVTYFTAVNTPVSFLSSDFNALCRNKTNRDMKYVTFTLPQASAGTLYYNYTGSGSDQTVTAGTQYYRNSSPYVDNITFVPASTCPSVVYISYQGRDSANQSFSGQVRINVSGGQGSSSTVTNKDVQYTADWGQQVIFRSSDFVGACQAAIGETLSYVRFSLPASGQGTLYLNYNSTSGTGTLVNAATNYYQSSAPSIGGVSFVPAASAGSRIAIPYTGYSTRGTTYNGTVYIVYGNPSNPTVRYSTYSGRLVNFQAANFNSACLAATGYNLDYVQFTGQPGSTQGVLYYNYSASSSYNNQAYTGTSYYRTGSSYQNQLGSVSFLPAKGYTGSVTIPYTGYSVVGANGSRSTFTGTVVIQVAAPAPNDINLSTTSAVPVKLSSATVRTVCNAVLDQGLSYIQITSLPASTAGTLYSNYNGVGTGNQVTTGSRFYGNGTPGIDQLSFVPRSGYRGTAVIGYTGVSSTGQQVSGRINISIGSSGTYSRYNAMANYSWASDAVEYLSQNGVVNGMGGGTFGPSLSIRRCDFVVMLCRAFHLSGGSGYSFADVPTDSYYANAVATAKRLGIVSGDGTNFRPNENLSRQDAMVMIYNTLEASGHNLTNGLTADLSIFRDYSQISPYALNSVGILVYMGAVKGDGTGYLHPWSAINRAEAAVLIHFIMTQA